MNRTVALITGFAVALPLAAVAAPLHLAAVAAPVHLVVSPRLGTEIVPRLVMARLAETIEIENMPDGMTKQLIQWQRGVRDLAHAARTRLAAVISGAGFQIPDLTVLAFEPVEDTESSGFGWRDDPIRHRPKFHSGTDFRGKSGTPVLAAGDGVVVFSGRRGGYGNVIDVDHGGGVVTRYAHLRRIEAARDAAVSGGQPIGQLGSTGRATGPHLHFEVRLDGRPVDPVLAMTIGEISRTAPEAGQLAAFALSPELQSQASSRLDPPKHKLPKKQSRPERRGRATRVQPLS